MILYSCILDPDTKNHWMVNIHVAVLPFVDKMEFDETVLSMDHNRVIFIESTARIVEHLVDTDNCLYLHASHTLWFAYKFLDPN